MRKKKKRFQDCGTIEKLWRRRLYLKVPYWAIKTYLCNPAFVDYRFDVSWGLAMGSAEVEMERYYTSDEVKILEKERINEHN